MFELNSWHPLTLPSMGRFYKDKMPGGQVQVTPWTTQQEEDLVRHGGKADFNLRVLRNNVQLPEGLSLEDLLVGDQFFLLVQLRINSLSPYLTYTWPCECEKRTETQIDLRTMTCRTPDEDEDNPFDVKLPRADVMVTMAHQTVRDLLAVQEYAKTHDEGATQTFRFSRQIQAVDGHSLKYDEMKDFVRGLSMLDFQILRRALNDRQIGYILTMDLTCDHCGSVSKQLIPLQNSFFRPDRADLDRAAADLADGDRAPDTVPGV